MKTVIGLQLAISQEGDEVFNAKTINDFVLNEIKGQLEEKKFKLETYKHDILCFNKEKYEEEELKIIKYHEKIYNEKVSFRSSVNDAKYGNISQFILADQIRKGVIDKQLFLKQNDKNAIVVIVFETQNKKLDEAIRSVGNNIYAEYFKYDFN